MRDPVRRRSLARDEGRAGATRRPTAPADDVAANTSMVLFASVIALFLPYVTWFIWNTSFVVEGTRYFCLADDAMISMTYARNAAAGHGWVWNPGQEPVEGYTNPLWTAYMTLVHFFPIDGSKTSLVVQLTCALCLCGNLWFVQALVRRLTGGSPGFACAAMLLAAFYYPLNMWSLQGMEVGPLAVLVSGLTWYALRTLDEQRFLSRVYVLIAAAVLTRMDMVITSTVVWLFLVLQDRARRTRHLIAGFSALAGTLALLTLWRWWVYGDLLPNTYYLKMQGYPALPRIVTGLINFTSVAYQQNLLLLVAPIVLLTLEPRAPALLLAALFVAQSAYSIYVGGDAWEWFGGTNRYVSTVMPLFIVLLTVTGWQAWRALRLAFPEAAEGLGLSRWRRFAIGALVFLSVLVSLNTPNGLGSLGRLVFLEPPLNAVHHPTMVALALHLRRITRPEARVAVVWAGIIPYFAERSMIDVLGKNDRHVARLPMHGSADPAPGTFYPGHLKWDYAYSIQHLQADVVTHAWPDWETVTPFLDGFEAHRRPGSEDPYYLRTDSPRIIWERVAAANDRVDDADLEQ